MEAPVITLATRTGYSSIWGKYVEAVDLSVHCIDSLIGPRQRGIDHRNPSVPIVWDQHPVPAAFYLCGVTYPYRWEANLHILATYSPGHTAEVKVPGGSALLEHLRPHQIKDADIPGSEPLRKDRLFRTCRNWQAAWMLHRRLQLENKPNPDRLRWRKRPKQRVGAPDLPLF